MLSCSVLCKELESRGYSVMKKNLNLDSDSDSNAEKIYGLVLETGDVNKEIVIPVDYVLNNANTVQMASDMVQHMIDHSKLPDGVDYYYFLKKDYLLSHVKLAMMEKLWQPFLFKDSIFDGIIEYCYISGIFNKQRWLVEIREDMIQDLGITQEELWEAARKNTIGNDFDFVLKPVAEIMGKKLKVIVDKTPVKYMYSISNKMGLQGAYQVLNPKIFDILNDYSVDTLIIYPQSENNCLVAPSCAGVLQTMKNIAVNDDNFRYLSDNLYEVGKGFEVKKVIPFGSPTIET